MRVKFKQGDDLSVGAFRISTTIKKRANVDGRVVLRSDVDDEHADSRHVLAVLSPTRGRPSTWTRLERSWPKPSRQADRRR